MVKTLELLRRLVEVKRELEQDGGRDNALKGRYYDLFNRVYCRQVRGRQSGNLYVVVDVGFCGHPACEGGIIAPSPTEPGRLTFVHLSNLEEAEP